MGRAYERRQAEGAPDTAFPVGDTSFWGTTGAKREMTAFHCVSIVDKAAPKTAFCEPNSIYS